MLVPVRDRAANGSWEPGYSFHPAIAHFYFDHELQIARDNGVFSKVSHKFAVVRYLKPLEDLDDYPDLPCAYTRVSPQTYGFTGENVIPVQLLFARFMKYEETCDCVLVLPIVKKWSSPMDWSCDFEVRTDVH